MHPELLDYYNRELQHLREMGGEFAKAYPKIAARLGLESFECADPYVERLLEGFAFLTARIQQKHDHQFPQFSQQLLDMLYPHYLAPTPSMIIAKFEPDLAHSRLKAGVTVPRGSILHSRPGPHSDTRCTYRSAHALTLWPLTLTEAQYLRYSPLAADIPSLHTTRPACALLRLRFQLPNGLKANTLTLEQLSIYLQGADTLPYQLYEHLLTQQCGALLRWGPAAHQQAALPPLSALGLDEEQTLLPANARIFPGYRLLQEYFAFPQRYLFIEQSGFATALRDCDSDQFECLWLLDQHHPLFEQTLSASHFALFATPAINLFPLRAARIEISDEQVEYHIVADPMRPQDYEVCFVTTAQGYRENNIKTQRFEPFYHAHDLQTSTAGHAYYQLRREVRKPSARQAQDGLRTRYLGSETYIALVDTDQAPYRQDLHQLSLELLCSNRDLPLTMPLGGNTDFVTEINLPLKAIRCVSGPSQPQPMLADGKVAWRALNHLTINYIALAVGDPQNGLNALKSLLALYSPPYDRASQLQINGITALTTRTVTRRLPKAGPITFMRGVELTLVFDDNAFDGGRVFLLASILRRFFTHSASINSFVEVVAKSNARGEIMRWRALEGSCLTI